MSATAPPPASPRPRDGRPLAIAAAFLAVVAALALTVAGSGGQPLGVDRAWHDLLAASASPSQLGLAGILNVVGGTAVMAAITAVGAALILAGSRAAAPTPAGRWRAPVTLIAAVAGAALASELIKLLVARPRPADALIFARGDSFPSGHTTAAAAFAVVLALMLGRAAGWVIAAGWVLAMALSRTLLLVHWASDTIAGAALGTAAALIAWALLGRARLPRRAGRAPAGG